MFFYFFLEKLTPSFRKTFVSKQRDQTDIFLIRLKEFRDLRRPPIFPCNSLTKHFQSKTVISRSGQSCSRRHFKQFHSSVLICGVFKRFLKRSLGLN